MLLLLLFLLVKMLLLLFFFQTVHQMEFLEIVPQIHFIHNAFRRGRISGSRIRFGFCYLDGRRSDAHPNRFSLFEREISVIVDGIRSDD